MKVILHAEPSLLTEAAHIAAVALSGSVASLDTWTIWERGNVRWVARRNKASLTVSYHGKVSG